MTEQSQALYQAQSPSWKGTAVEQTLAERVYQIMMMQGVFFPQNVPVRQLLSNLAAYFAAQDDTAEASMREQIDAALQANDHVFRRTTSEDDVVFATTRLGYYTEPQVDTKHTFAQRLYQPENPLPVDDLDVIITRTRPALTTVEPVIISDYWQQRAPVDEDAEPESAGVVEAEAAPPAEAPAEAPAEPKAEPKTEPKAEPVAPQVPENSKVLVLDDQTAIDLRLDPETLLEHYGQTLGNILQQVITDDPLRRVVSFGDEYYPEDAVVSLSKGDLRRIREYILEQGEPMPDTAILNDVYYKTPRESDWATFRFALNYRLNREKDFEFVGVPGVRLWSVKGLAPVGTRRLKTSELGQFYSFLEEDQAFDDSLADTHAAAVHQARQHSHFLTFFEWEYGVLPYNAAFKALLPPPLLPDQRTAILRFEAPQHYTVYLAELRYPTSNRGGWIHGLEGFFKEHLVPGAMLTIVATDDPSIWILQYEETSGEEVKLLQQDDKKNRYSFANQSFYCAVDHDLVPAQERLPRLKNMKVLPSGERRRLTSTAGYVLEQVGQSRPGDVNGFELNIDDLYLGMNVQRPTTKSYLYATLAEDENFLIEDETFIYFPPPDDLPQIEDEDEDE